MFVDHCCDFLAAHSLGGEVAGASVFGAMLAHGDIPWRANNPSVGQLLKVGLNIYTGRPCSVPNAWRNVLATGQLLAPLPPRGVIRPVGEQSIPRPRVYQEGRDGVMRELAENEALRWSR